MSRFIDSKYTMIGGDLSHHNYDSVLPSYWDFVMLKASEGKTYQDGAMNKFLEIMSKDVPNKVPYIGFYHYARPENNTPNDEVNNFINTIRSHIGQCLVALDVEGEALKVKELDRWCLQWCMEVQDVTGSIPFVYTASGSAHLMPVTLKKFPLWVAHWGVQKPQSKRININPVMWQITSKPFDIDLFYGTPTDLESYVYGRNLND